MADKCFICQVGRCCLHFLHLLHRLSASKNSFFDGLYWLQVMIDPQLEEQSKCLGKAFSAELRQVVSIALSL